MKRLIALLLFAPVLASATGNDPFTGEITSGSMTFGGTSALGGASFSGSGQDFIANGTMIWSGENAPGPIGASNIIPFGSVAEFKFGTGGGDTGMSLSVDGVGGCSTDSAVAGAAASFDGFTAAPITHAGTYSGPLTFDAHLFPNSTPFPPACALGISGDGTMLLQVAKYPNPAINAFYPVSATVTFGAPEPSTGSLLLIGFAGVAVLGRRRRSRADSRRSYTT
jgi:hypothetical protein